MKLRDNQPVRLHIAHSWGGGLERWIRDFCLTDTECNNLVLKSVGVPGTPGQFLWLYSYSDEQETVLQRWELQPPIATTAIAHAEYCLALADIVDRYAVRGILVSSLIGHSLDVLETGLETAVICHDYYPFCPAINIYFDGICSQCDRSDLDRCQQHNPFNRFLPGALPAVWSDIRQYFRESIVQHQIPLVMPSQSVRTHLTQLDPAFSDARFRCIPHGVNWSVPPLPNRRDSSDQKLRVLVLGSLALHKGRDLLLALAPQIADIAEFYLLGYGQEGTALSDLSNVTAVSESYRPTDLAEKVAQIQPDLGLLLSIWPETFSYTLSELQILGIPTLATRTGSFAERIVDGDTGFLAEVHPEAVAEKLRSIAAKPDVIDRIAEKLRALNHKTVEAMLEEYRELLPLELNPPIQLHHQARWLQRLEAEEKHIQGREKRIHSQLEDIYQLQAQIEAMESSKFWKLRAKWFSLKALIGRFLK